MNFAHRHFPFSDARPFHLFKGDDTENSTQSNPQTTQTDNRVGASEQGVAVGSGGMLDQSFTDASATTISVADNSDRSTVDSRDQSFNDLSSTLISVSDNSDRSTVDSRNQSFTDASVTTLNTTDARAFDQSDRRTFTDNSTHYTLDAELAAAAISTGGKALADAGDVLSEQIRASQESARVLAETNIRLNADALGFATETARGSARLIDGTTTTAFATFGKTNSDSLEFAGQALERAFATAENLAELSMKDGESARAAQTGFLSSFYRDRESGDAKQSGDLIKYGTAAAIVAALAWAAKAA